MKNYIPSNDFFIEKQKYNFTITIQNIYIYIYIYREREREREIFWHVAPHSSSQAAFTNLRFFFFLVSGSPPEIM